MLFIGKLTTQMAKFQSWNFRGPVGVHGIEVCSEDSNTLLFTIKALKKNKQGETTADCLFPFLPGTWPLQNDRVHLVWNGFQRRHSAAAASTIDVVWITIRVGDISGILLPPAALPRATSNLWGAKRRPVGWAAAQFTWPFASPTPAVLSAKAPRLLAAPPGTLWLAVPAGGRRPPESWPASAGCSWFGGQQSAQTGPPHSDDG